MIAKYELYMKTLKVSEDVVSAKDPKAVFSFAKDVIGYDSFAEERLYTVFLNAQLEIIGYEETFKGSLAGITCSPREIYRAALLANAYGVIILHNHPSGNPRPSEDDRQLTEVVEKAGQMIGVQLLDHIIIGDKTYHSFKEDGLL